MALSKSKDESKSQLDVVEWSRVRGCLWPCQRAKMKANHNVCMSSAEASQVVYGLVKEQRWKQITTPNIFSSFLNQLFMALSKSKDESKSQPLLKRASGYWVVYGLVKEQRWKQITTIASKQIKLLKLFMALSKSKDESKSQHLNEIWARTFGCLWPCQRAKMKANHNPVSLCNLRIEVVYGLVKEQRWKQITTI